MFERIARWHLERTKLEIFRFTVCLTTPVLLMFWMGSNTSKKLNVPDFWPDPARLNQIPKDRVELKQEIERLRQERLAKKAAREAREGGEAEASEN